MLRVMIESDDAAKNDRLMAKLLEAIAYHEAGYLVAASVAQVPVRKPRSRVGGLHRCASHVLELEAITEPEDKIGRASCRERVCQYV